MKFDTAWLKPIITIKSAQVKPIAEDQVPVVPIATPVRNSIDLDASPQNSDVTMEDPSYPSPSIPSDTVVVSPSEPVKTEDKSREAPAAAPSGSGSLPGDQQLALTDGLTTRKAIFLFSFSLHHNCIA